jgi:8-oxo-dGTP diphosphatase
VKNSYFSTTGVRGVVENEHMRIVGIIIKDDKILLMRRVKNGQKYYVFPGGSIENNETVEDALEREIKEETGLFVRSNRKLFEIENQGRREAYYLIEEFDGALEIKGPEKERANEQNQYYLEWMKWSVIRRLNNLYPQEAIRRLSEFIRIKQ